MKPQHRASAAALAATLAGFCPLAALAAEHPCPGMTIEPDIGFRARFPDLAQRIQDEFGARGDLDKCARVELGLVDEAITVSVALPDGRTASRSVMRREDVALALQALLLVPARPASAPPAPPAPPPAAPRRATGADRPNWLHRDTPTPTSTARRLGVELSLITGARVGDGQVGYGVGALSFLEVHGWLLGFQGRADGYRSLAGGDPETALELAILTGRRFDFGSVALDLTAGPAVAMKGLAFSHTRSGR